jgi:hypothetical protein
MGIIMCRHEEVTKMILCSGCGSQARLRILPMYNVFLLKDMYYVACRSPKCSCQGEWKSTRLGAIRAWNSVPRDEQWGGRRNIWGHVIPKLVIGGLEFVGGGMCPEQYDVFLGGKQVGYVRLRHGGFTVDYPSCLEENLLDTNDVRGDGCFDDDVERSKWLTKAAELINNKIASVRSNHKKIGK